MTMSLVVEHFDDLIAAPEDVEQLNQAILEMAVGGNLADSDLGDKPNGEEVQLGNHIDLISGQHILNVDYNCDGIGVPYITGPADFGNVYPVISKWTTKPKVTAIENDILITVKGAGL